MPRELFSVELVKAIEGAYKKMQVKELRDAFYYGFITNFFVWIRAPVEVQKALIGLVFKMHQTMGREMNVQKTLSIIRLFYWITRKRTSLAASSRDQRPGTEDIFQLRRALFAIIKARLSGEVHRDDVAALVSFILNAAMPLNGVSKEQQQQQQQQQQSTLGTGSNSGPATPAMSPVPGEGHGEAAVTVSELDENDDGDIPSALKIIIDILSSKSITFAEQLFGNGGVEALMQALWVPSEKIRVLAIEALSRLTYVLLGAPALQGTERHYVREIATSLWYVLARVPGGMTEGLYSALLRMAVSDFSCKSPVTVSEKSTRLVFPEVVFLAILPLLKDCPRDLRLRAYRDLGAILGRDLNCRKVLIFAGWQHYLCKTIDVERRLGDEEAHAGACSALGLIIQELVFAAAEYLLGWDPIRDFFAVFAHFDSYVGGGDEFFIDVHIAFSKAYLARIVKAIKGETPENIRAIISPASEQFATVISTLVYITDFFLIYAPSVSTPYIHSVKFFLKNLATTRARPEQGEQQQQQQQSQSSPRGKIGTAVGATATATPAASPAKQQQGKIPVPEPPQSPSGRPAPPSIPSSPVNAHAMAPQLPQGSPMKGVEGEGNAVDAVEERAGEQEQQEQQQQQLQKETAAAKRRADRAQGEVLVLSQILGYVDYFRLPAVGGWAGAEKSRLGSPMLRTRGSGFIGMSVEICVRLVQVFALVGSVDHGKKCYAALLFLSTIASDYIPQHGSIQSQFHYILDTSLISFTLSIENRMAEITNELFKFFGKLTETLGEVKKLSKLVSKQNCPAIEVLISKAQHGSVEELAEFLKTDSWKKAGEEIRAKAQAYVQFTLSVYDKAIAIRRDSMYAVIDLIKAGAHTMRPFAASDAMLSAAKDDNRRIEKLSRKLTDINDESSVK